MNDFHPERPGSSEGVTTLGPTITVKGELTSQEHLIIEGRFEGRIEIPNHGLAVGRAATVEAELLAHSITVLGTVRGTVRATEKVELRDTAKVEADIESPRVAMSDGAILRGTLEIKPDVSQAARDDKAKSDAQIA